MFFKFYSGSQSENQSNQVFETLYKFKNKFFGGKEDVKTYEAKTGDFQFKWTRELFDNLTLVPVSGTPGDEGVTMDELIKRVGKPVEVKEDAGTVEFIYNGLEDKNYRYVYTFISVYFERIDTETGMDGDYYAVQKSAINLPLNLQYKCTQKTHKIF